MKALSVRIRQVLTHPLVKGGILLSVSQYCAATLHFITITVAARLLGPSDYGVATLVMAYPALLLSFIGVKSKSVITRYVASFRIADRKNELNSICKLGYGLDFFASIIAFILIGTTGWWIAYYVYDIPNAFWLMIIYSASFPFYSLLGTSWAILSSWQQFRYLAFLQIFNEVVLLVFVIVFLLSGFGFQGMVLATAISQAVAGVVALAISTCLLYRDGFGLWWGASLGNIVSLQKELMTFFGWNYLVVTLNGIVAQVPLMLLGKFKGPEEVGFYRLATSLMTIGSYLESSLVRVVYPDLSARWATGERESLKASFKRWTLQGGIPIGIIFLMVIPILPILVPLVFGPKFSPMVSGVQILMIGSAISVVFFWLNPLYYASGKIGSWTVGYLIYTLLIVSLSWFIIQRWGFFGLAMLMTIGKVTFILSMLVFFLRDKI